jgi:hypothetical protein
MTDDQVWILIRILITLEYPMSNLAHVVVGSAALIVGIYFLTVSMRMRIARWKRNKRSKWPH